jgi:hypothetical protein
MAKKRVHVHERNGEFFVEPAVLELNGPPGGGGGGGAADTVRLVNHTGEDLIWNVPAGVFQANPVIQPVARRSLSPSFTAQSHPNPGYHEYQVLMVQSGKKAKGNSDPVIIIED